MRAIALCYPYPYSLDHLSPIADLLNIPLLVFDESMKTLAETFCPSAKVIYEKDFEAALPFYFRNYDLLFHTMLSWSAHALMLKELYNSLHTRIAYVPHGNSDKRLGMHNDAFCHDIFLLYGKHMYDLLFEGFDKRNINAIFSTGNLRANYYQKNQKRLDDLFNKSLLKPLDFSKKTILIAPTWDDSEFGFTFFNEISRLISDLSANFNVLIKLHPATKDSHTLEWMLLDEEIKNHKTIQILQEFPFIYPILNVVDIFLSDGRSSIGYDFLYFDRPLYLMNNQHSNSLLAKCSMSLSKEENASAFINKSLEQNIEKLSPQRKRLYSYAFDPINLNKSNDLETFDNWTKAILNISNHSQTAR